MSRYRKRLPQLKNRLFMTDGGMETTLIFHEGMNLPCFASFDLLKDEAGWATLRRYFATYVDLARANRLGLLLETPTWRANPDWGAKLGYDAAALADVHRKSVGLLLEIREEFETTDTPMVACGVVGPRGDGYQPGARMSSEEARAYHAPQIATFAQTDADMVAAYTMNYIEEGIGIVQAACAAAMPVSVSFTVETDGRLPSGETLEQAITRTDAETGRYAAYYMINCAHPAHFEHTIGAGSGWLERIWGIRANASRRSHQELDEAPDLDDGDPVDLGARYRALKSILPRLSVAGGCCGTDHRHVAEICRALQAA
jgi:S-methylmethionine-dependent homocysteine/selenocysteine methylase